MAIQEINKNYVFPRIPLNLEVPEDYPNVGKVSVISVVPHVQKFRFYEEELEISGEYQVTLSYLETGKGVNSERPGLFSFQVLRPFHTFVDKEFIIRPRFFRPALVVERVEVKKAGDRGVTGELVLALVNRGKRNR